MSWSTRHDFYVHQFENPRVQRFSKEFVLDIAKFNNTNPFASLVSQECTDQKAILISISLKTINNGYDTDIPVFFSNLYPSQEKPLQIRCPANSAFTVKESDRNIFQHTLKPDKIVMYAGLDTIIMKDTQKSSTTDFECFPHNHPITEFVLNHGALLKPEDGDVVKKDGDAKTYYLIKTTFVEKIREFFADKIFSDMNYTRFENTKLFCNIPSPPEGSGEIGNTLLFVLEVDYALINPGTGELFHTEEKLK